MKIDAETLKKTGHSPSALYSVPSGNLPSWARRCVWRNDASIMPPGASHERRAFNLSALAVRERSVTLFLIILISVAGLVAFFGLGRAEDPPFTVKQMTVITVWPGATAQEMQDQVAEPLEKRLQELKWYDRTETLYPPRHGVYHLIVARQNAPAEVQEEFYQARKKAGRRIPESPCRDDRPDDQ